MLKNWLLILRQIINKKLCANTRLKTISKVLLIFLVSLAISEIVIRIAGLSESEYFIPQSNKSSSIITFNPRILNNYYNSFSSLPYYVSSNFKREKEADEYRIFLFGEASAAGWPYSAGQSLASKIKNNLKNISATKKINVIDNSFSGFNSSHAVDLVSQIMKYNPDLIIIYNGHNEFYGYKGVNGKVNNWSSVLYTLGKNFLLNSGLKEKLPYDFNLDDLELLLPIYSDEQMIRIRANNFKSIKNQFEENISQIIELCNENNVGLILSVLADNYQRPPIGVFNIDETPSADLIFNNARMALLRDGNKFKALELFYQSNELDAFRLRISKEFNESIEQIAETEGVSIADLKSKFLSYSQDNIPGNDLFVDYIHPNIKGLGIIASVYTELILQKLYLKDYEIIQFKPEADSENYKYGDDEKDRTLSIMRIGKVHSLLEQYRIDNADNSGASSKQFKGLTNNASYSQNKIGEGVE